VEYAEPVYENLICEIPNDSLFNQQFYLIQINAPDAWDWQKGILSVTVAIVDNGTDYNHKDLRDNIWANNREANGVFGVDDDGNGYVDDIHGWDFGNNDSDPRPFSPDIKHGTATAGIACAVTNNGIGMAGAGWNCKFMPIVGQDVIQYAYKKGAVVVCAAGNYSSEVPFYPASYHRAISVAAVDAKDCITMYSSYGIWVDICAPGGVPNNGLISTNPENKYGKHCGTSFSSPLVAGICALIKSHHPEWTPDQVMKQLILTTEDITSVNGSLADKLGSGRLNASRAITAELDPFSQQSAKLHIVSQLLTDSTLGNANNIFERDETIELILNVQNFALLETDKTTCTIVSNSKKIQLLNSQIGPFHFSADTTLPLNFSFRIREDAYSGMDSLTLTISSDLGFYETKKIFFTIGDSPILLLDHDLSSVDQQSPDITLTYQNILNKKRLPYIYWDTGIVGFPDLSSLEKYPLVLFTCASENSFFLNKQQRNVFRKYLDKGGYLFLAGQNIGKFLSISPSHEAEDFLNAYLHAKFISNNSGDLSVEAVPVEDMNKNTSFQIWQPYLPANLQSPDVIEPTEGASAVFRYGNGNSAGIKYTGTHKVIYFGFGLESVDADINTNLADLSLTRTDLFMRTLNWLNFLELQPLDSIVEVNSSIKIKVKLSNLVSNIKSVSLFWRPKTTTGFSKIEMTETGAGMYIVEIPVQSGNINIEYYLKLNNSYYDWHSPVGAPDSLHNIQHIPTDVTKKISQITDFKLEQNYPNPFNPETTIQFNLPMASEVLMEIYNSAGQLVETLVKKRLGVGLYNVKWDATQMSSGIYFYRIKAGRFVDMGKMVLLH
jgi:hypothetical protein